MLLGLPTALSWGQGQYSARPAPPGHGVACGRGVARL